MYCPACGATNKEGINFCTKCGTPLKIQTAESQPQMVSQGMSAMPQGMSMQPQMVTQGRTAQTVTPKKKFPIIPVIASVLVLAIVAVVLVVVLKKDDKGVTMTCDMCQLEKKCQEYNVTGDGETTSHWLCKDCSSEDYKEWNTCEGCDNFAECEKYTVYYDNETDTGWLCVNCANEMYAAVQVLNADVPNSASITKVNFKIAKK